MLFTQPTRSLTEIVQEKLLNSFEIRPFPQVVVRLLTKLRNPNVSLQDLTEIVQSDAALCSRVLKIANSPIMGTGHKVTRVDQAITILGFNRMKSLAQTHAAAAVINGDGSNTEIRQKLWQHSLATATAARIIAQRINVTDQADAFLAGIFHDVGHLFFLDVVAESYVPLMLEGQPLKMVEKEQNLFGISHQEAGMKLAVAWELPETIRLAIGFHHRPQQAIAHEELVWVIQLADCLVHAYGIGSVVDPSVMQTDLLRGPFRLTPELINAIRAQVAEEFEEFQQAYA